MSAMVLEFNTIHDLKELNRAFNDHHSVDLRKSVNFTVKHLYKIMPRVVKHLTTKYHCKIF